MRMVGPILLFIAALLVSGCMGGGNNKVQVWGVATSTTLPSTPVEKHQEMTTQPAIPSDKAASETEKTNVMPGALTDLAAAMISGTAYKCTYTYMSVISEAYVKGRNFRSTTTVLGHGINVLSDGFWVYQWTEGQASGFKYSVKDLKSAPAETNSQAPTNPTDISKSAVNVQCTPTVADDSIFIPPSSVQFQDMGAALKQLQNIKADGKVDPCAACSMIQDQDIKQKCLSQCGEKQNTAP